MQAARVLSVLVLSVLVLGGCGSDSSGGRSGDPVEVDSEDVGVKISARDQENDGASIVIDEAELPTDGYVVVYADGGGAPGVQLGASELLTAGQHDDVEITLDPPVTESGDVFVIIHSEGNANTTFDGNTEDPPQTEDGNVLLVTISLDVE